MTTQHITSAAALVHSIAHGRWTNDPPSFAAKAYDTDISSYARAVQTAEVFIMWFQADDPTFNVDHFLLTCGLRKAACRPRR